MPGSRAETWFQARAAPGPERVGPLRRGSPGLDSRSSRDESANKRRNHAGSLERMIFFSEQSLRRAVAEFILHYHGERNHQGLGNALLEAEECVGSPHGKVRCRKRLGGLLSYYHRDARGHNKAAIAVASKLARIVWAVSTRESEFQSVPAAA